MPPRSAPSRQPRIQAIALAWAQERKKLLPELVGKKIKPGAGGLAGLRATWPDFTQRMPNPTLTFALKHKDAEHYLAAFMAAGVDVIFWHPLALFHDHLEATGWTLPCPCCGGTNVTSKGWNTVLRRVMSLACVSYLYTVKYECSDCKALAKKNPAALPPSFETYELDDIDGDELPDGGERAASSQAAAPALKVSWNGTFHSAHPGVLSRLPPFIAAQFPCIMTHRGAVTKEVVALVKHSIMKEASFSGAVSVLQQMHAGTFYHNSLAYYQFCQQLNQHFATAARLGGTAQPILAMPEFMEQGYVPSAAYISKLVMAAVKEELEYAARWMQGLGGEVLRMDHTF